MISWKVFKNINPLSVELRVLSDSVQRYLNEKYFNGCMVCNNFKIFDLLISIFLSFHRFFSFILCPVFSLLFKIKRGSLAFSPMWGNCQRPPPNIHKILNLNSKLSLTIPHLVQLSPSLFSTLHNLFVVWLECCVYVKIKEESHSPIDNPK